MLFVKEKYEVRVNILEVNVSTQSTSDELLVPLNMPLKIPILCVIIGPNAYIYMQFDNFKYSVYFTMTHLLLCVTEN